MRRKLIVLVILGVLLLCTLSELVEASGSLYATYPSSYLKAGDYVNYTAKQFPIQSQTNRTVTNFLDIQIVGIDNVNYTIELHIIQ